MSDRLWAAALFYPAPLWVGALVLQQIAGSEASFWLGFLLALGVGSATGFGLLRHPVGVGLAVGSLGVAMVVPILDAPAAGAGWLGVAVGVLLGTPFLWIEFAWRERYSPAVRLLALQSTLLAGVAFLAARGNPVAPNSSPPAGQFLQSLGQAFVQQLAGMVQLVSGAAPGNLPFQSAFDPVTMALGGVALVALVLSWIPPRTALDEPLPWSWFRFIPSAGPGPLETDEVDLRDGQRAAIATRTRPIPPDTVLSPGFGSLLAAGLLVAAWLALVVAAPSLALVALGAAVVAGLTGLAFVLSRRLTPLGGLAE